MTPWQTTSQSSGRKTKAMPLRQVRSRLIFILIFLLNAHSQHVVSDFLYEWCLDRWQQALAQSQASELPPTFQTLSNYSKVQVLSFFGGSCPGWREKRKTALLSHPWAGWGDDCKHSRIEMWIWHWAWNIHAFLKSVKHEIMK